MDNQKDEYIKERLQKDVLISKNADNVFNNFLKGELNNMEENQEDKTINFTKAKKKNNKLRALLATVATVCVVLGSANVYASTNGYGNVFFMIKYLITGENSVVGGKENILSDKDITISYEEIRILPNITIQVKKMQVKDGKAYLYVVENSTEEDEDIIPLTYKVYNEDDEELASHKSYSVAKEQIIIMDNYKDTDDILYLKIYKSNGNLVTTLKIDLESRTIVVEGEEEALQKISEIELKDFLGRVSLVYDIDGSLRSNLELLDAAMTILSDREVSVFYEDSTSNIAVEKDEVDKTLDALAGVSIPSKTTSYNVVSHSKVDYYEVKSRNDYNYESTCLDISDISYCAGEYTVVYTYANTEELNNGNFNVYENTILLSINDDFHYSKFKIDSIVDTNLISQAEDLEDNTKENFVDVENSDENTNTTKYNSNTTVINTTSSNLTNTYSYTNTTSTNTNTTTSTNSVNNYASTMSWTAYWAPGIKFSYPTIFNLEEIGGYDRGSKPGECTTKISGVATGIDPDTKQIINSNLTINVYEPMFVESDSEYMLDSLGNFIGLTVNSSGYKWAQKITQDLNGNTVDTYYHSEEMSDGTFIIYRIDFVTDNPNNYKVVNIEDWLLGTTKVTSY